VGEKRGKSCVFMHSRGPKTGRIDQGGGHLGEDEKEEWVQSTERVPNCLTANTGKGEAWGYLRKGGKGKPVEEKEKD